MSDEDGAVAVLGGGSDEEESDVPVQTVDRPLKKRKDFAEPEADDEEALALRLLQGSS